MVEQSVKKVTKKQENKTKIRTDMRQSMKMMKTLRKLNQSKDVKEMHHLKDRFRITK